MAQPIVYGPSYSTYVRTVRLVLAEKSVAYDFHHVGMLEGEHQRQPFLERNPYGKVPAFEHDGLKLYETNVITRYIDRAFPGTALQPADARGLAVMDQAISIADTFGYGAIVGKLVWQRMVVPMMKGTPDDKAVADAMPQIKLTLAEYERILGDMAWFGGADLSLADLHLAPIFAYMSATPEGGELMGAHPKLGAWWAKMSARESMSKTEPQFG